MPGHYSAWNVTIIEEIRRYREEYAARFNYDLHAICENLRRRQGSDGRKVVSLPPMSYASAPLSGGGRERDGRITMKAQGGNETVGDSHPQSRVSQNDSNR